MKIGNIEVSGITRVCYIDKGEVWYRAMRSGKHIWMEDAGDACGVLFQDEMIARIKDAAVSDEYRVWFSGDTANIAIRADRKWPE